MPKIKFLKKKDIYKGKESFTKTISGLKKEENPEKKETFSKISTGPFKEKSSKDMAISSKEINPDGTSLESSVKKKGDVVTKSETFKGPETALSYAEKEKVEKPKKPILGFLGLAKKKK